ncbi:MAG: hypothetical protein H6732_16985 [Alphaproteobacteria bacterium]|nr:hypothetical protein [Alphaproteobacteria bacterium]
MQTRPAPMPPFDDAPSPGMALTRDELPVGPVVDGPARPRRVRFAVAVPTLLSLFVATALGSALVVVAGAEGWLTDLGAAATPLAVGSVLVAALVGTLASRAGWGVDRPAGPWRPLVYGVVASTVTLGVAAWLAWFSLEMASAA